LIKFDVYQGTSSWNLECEGGFGKSVAPLVWMISELLNTAKFCHVGCVLTVCSATRHFCFTYRNVVSRHGDDMCSQGLWGSDTTVSRKIWGTFECVSSRGVGYFITRWLSNAVIMIPPAMCHWYLDSHERKRKNCYSLSIPTNRGDLELMKISSMYTCNIKRKRRL
jgi:hypothetical protein